MNPEQIKALKEAHPQEFAAKRAAGLTDEQAASVIAAQIAHDQAHPPGPIALGKARTLAELARVRFDQLKTLFKEADEAFNEAVKLNPDIPPKEIADFPPLIVDSSHYKTFTDLRESLAKREDDVIKLEGQIVELETEIATARADLQGLRLDHQALLTEKEELKNQIALKDERIAQLEGEIMARDGKPKSKK